MNLFILARTLLINQYDVLLIVHHSIKLFQVTSLTLILLTWRIW